MGRIPAIKPVGGIPACTPWWDIPPPYYPVLHPPVLYPSPYSSGYTLFIMATKEATSSLQSAVRCTEKELWALNSENILGGKEKRRDSAQSCEERAKRRAWMTRAVNASTDNDRIDNGQPGQKTTRAGSGAHGRQYCQTVKVAHSGIRSSTLLTSLSRRRPAAMLSPLCRCPYPGPPDCQLYLKAVINDGSQELS